MGLDYSQKRLFNIVLRRRGKGRGHYATLSPMRRKQRFTDRLEIYAFWMGFTSTIISLLQVIIIAIKQ